MDGLIEILKYSIPALIIALTLYYIYRVRTKKETATQKHERQLVFLKTIIPLRIQAYERIVLLLERITPQNLIMRVSRPGMNAVQLKSALTANIREEFEHNMSQQVYISINSWEMVRTAKEDMINLVNTSFAELPGEAAASDLIRNVFDKYLSQEKPAVLQALHAVKQEMGSQD